MATNLDYTNRDYLSIRQDMLDRAQVMLPEWRSQDPTDFGVVILEAVAAMLDSLHYYVDRAANEAFLESALRRRSVLAIAEMLDYRPSPRTSAAVTMTFTRAAGYGAAVSVPAGTIVATASGGGDSAVYFQTTLPLSFSNPTTSGTVQAVEGLSVVNEVLGTSVGLPNQEFLLAYAGIYEDSVQLFVLEGALDGSTPPQPAPIEWRKVDRLIEVDSLQGAFTVRTDENGSTYIQLGDDITGRIPAVNIMLKASYRYGVGDVGNVGAGVITVLPTAVTGVGSVSNAAPASGGANAESIESMRTSIPQSFGAQDRGVTPSDYRALALQVPEVYRANSVYGMDAGGSTPLEIYVTIAPSTPIVPSVALKTAVDNYLTERAMAGHTVTVVDPVYVPINVSVNLTVLPQYVQSWVAADVTAAVNSILAYESVDFDVIVKLGEMYRALFDVEGVDTVAIIVLSRTGSGVADVNMSWKEIPRPGTIAVTSTGGIVV